jgi:acyl-coenzyme A synthetase/AMP-(fatty) acid ligase
LESEIGAFDELWASGLPSCRFHSTVSHRHVYGLLFRLLWPLLSRQPFAGFDLAYPEQLIKASNDPEILIASPALLKRIEHLGESTRAWTQVYSSGGLLVKQAAIDSARVLGACPIEVLGSTETSGVAWRQQTGEVQSWLTLPAVSIRTDASGFLEVLSPFSGVDEWLPMGDFATINGDTRFDLLGRGDHIVKIEDKRVSLAAIEQALLKSAWVGDAAPVGLSKSQRQFVGAVIELTAAGRARLNALGRKTFGAMLRAELQSIEPIARPRYFRYVDQIPENTQGKRESKILAELFE